ncbi:helix-turn-helix domain-containing protein [Shouchella sp. JSM 1781072]|uniref:helix-turn-helix domain-containing protein n=1 Tax=Shouchella sp. JSM 1781072 TaxID=3344581 RepID=UPI0035BF4426
MIHENLRTLRKMNKFTQEYVAEKLQVSRQAIAKWEAGETVPDLNYTIALANLFDVRIDDLVSKEEKQYGIGPKGKHIFGVATVGERGQIVLPQQARDIFNLKTGDKLMILGDEEQGIALVKNEHFLQFANGIFAAQEEDFEDE